MVCLLDQCRGTDRRIAGISEGEIGQEKVHRAPDNGLTVIVTTVSSFPTTDDIDDQKHNKYDFLHL